MKKFIFIFTLLIVLSSCSLKDSSINSMEKDFNFSNESLSNTTKTEEIKTNYLSEFVEFDFSELSNTTTSQSTSSFIKTNYNSRLPLYESYLQQTDIELLINNNPIDIDFLKSENEIIGTTVEMVEHYGDYITIWENEMNNALIILEQNLQPENVESLKTAQNNWTEYLINDIVTSDQLHTDYFGIGSEMPVLTGYKHLLKVRQRTLELIEYCYIATDNYEFIYFD